MDNKGDGDENGVAVVTCDLQLMFYELKVANSC
jgi:hypothetical protein